MTRSAWRPRALSPSVPVYRAIADALAADRAAGRLTPGERLPTHRALADSLGVTVTTVSRAYAEATRRGLVEGTVGRGTFVRAPGPGPGGHVGGGARLTFDFDDGTGNGTVGPAVRPVDLGPNHPAAVGAEQRLAETLAVLATDPAALQPLAAYQLHDAAPRYRAAGATWMARAGMPDDPDAVVVTGGVQHGIAVTMLTLLRPGETALCADICYPGIKLLAHRHGVDLVGVPLDAEGLVPDALDEAAARTGARALFCIPTLQNPTAAVSSPQRRAALAEVAERRDLTVIEDDIYGLLPEQRPAPLATLIPHRTVFLTGTAKALAPGLRTGFAQVPPTLRAQFVATVWATIWMAAPLMVEITTRWIEDGTADALVAAQRRAVAERLVIAAEELGDLPWHGGPNTLHLWLTLPAPWRAEAFRDILAARGVLVQPAAVFHVGPGRMPEGVRLCVGGEPDLDRLRGALAAVRAVYDAGPFTLTRGP
ncbi:aminotransferase-like domain-containing protein [Roseospira marina]|nr:PLP-dependent aminotransferase family protein [Roseospira marina]MBB4313726.1 DNA-binding transcriptional MocR family regulator [Roseospira marina]MBB5086888.1 DNA-binding transcriptional MocR family regulator [Roseospira marina]